MDLHTNDSSESAAGVFVSDKCQIPVGGIPQQEPDRQQYYMALCRQKVQEISDKLGRPLTCFISTFGCQMKHTIQKSFSVFCWKQDLWKEPVRNRISSSTIHVQSVKMRTCACMDV